MSIDEYQGIMRSWDQFMFTIPPSPSVLFMSSIWEFDRKFGQPAMKCDKKETLEIYFQYESNNLTFVTYNSIFKNVWSMFY